jgi:CheY-like chemotaxis protein
MPDPKRPKLDATADTRPAPAETKVILTRTPVTREFAVWLIQGQSCKICSPTQAGILLKILIADDSDHVRRALRTCLELNPDWEVCAEAQDGRAAIEAVRKSPPDLVLLDYAMPLMNGLEAAREIKEIAPQSALFLFTMYSSEPLKKMAEDVGVRAVISKDVGGVGALVKAIEEMISQCPTQ